MKIPKSLLPFITVLVLYFLVSIPVVAGPPAPAATDLLKTTGAGFNIDRSARALYYTMNYQIRKVIKAPLYVSIQFQNPDNSDAPFIKNAIFKPNQKVFRVESPAFKRIRNNHSYEVLVILYDDKERKNLISKHSQQVYFSVPKKLAPKLGVELIK